MYKVKKCMLSKHARMYTYRNRCILSNHDIYIYIYILIFINIHIYIVIVTFIFIPIHTYIYKKPDRSGQAEAFIDGRRYGPIVSSYKTGRLDGTLYVGGWTHKVSDAARTRSRV